MRVVILAGGQGTRLWPWSVPSRPKQFLNLVDPRLSMFQKTCLLASSAGAVEIVVIVNERLEELVRDQIASLKLPPVRFLLEPVGRNTAPAIAAACLSVSDDMPMVVMPSDHLWQDRVFITTVREAVELSQKANSIVTIGIQASYPETGYGYIEHQGCSVLAFREKPDAATAETYIRSGNHLWNSGVFVFRPSVMLSELLYWKPILVDAVRKALVDSENFYDVEDISIDYAVMEKAKSVLVVPYKGVWNDVGSYRALQEVVEPTDEAGNHLRGKVRTIDTSDTMALIPEAGNIRVNLLGVQNLIVVVSDDGRDILITTPSASQKVNRFK